MFHWILNDVFIIISLVWTQWLQIWDKQWIQIKCGQRKKTFLICIRRNVFWGPTKNSMRWMEPDLFPVFFSVAKWMKRSSKFQLCYILRGIKGEKLTKFGEKWRFNGMKLKNVFLSSSCCLQTQLNRTATNTCVLNGLRFTSLLVCFNVFLFFSPFSYILTVKTCSLMIIMLKCYCLFCISFTMCFALFAKGSKMYFLFFFLQISIWFLFCHRYVLWTVWTFFF